MLILSFDLLLYYFPIILRGIGRDTQNFHFVWKRLEIKYFVSMLEVEMNHFWVFIQIRILRKIFVPPESAKVYLNSRGSRQPQVESAESASEKPAAVSDGTTFFPPDPRGLKQTNLTRRNKIRSPAIPPESAHFFESPADFFIIFLYLF